MKNQKMTLDQINYLVQMLEEKINSKEVEPEEKLRAIEFLKLVKEKELW